MKRNYLKLPIFLLCFAFILTNVASFSNVSNTTSNRAFDFKELTVAPCSAPASQPTSLSFTTSVSSTFSGSFTATTADEYLVIASTSASLSALPINGTVYTPGNTIGNATVISRGSSTSFSATGMNASTKYYLSVFALNSAGCSAGPAYRTAAPLSGSITTLAAFTLSQPTILVIGSMTNNSITGSFTASSATGYLVVASTSPNLTRLPVDNTNYISGDTIGNATVVSAGTSTSSTASGLSSSTTYYISVFAYAIPPCNCGIIYKTVSPLTGTADTMAACMAPSNSPSSLVFGTPTTTTVSGSFTATAADSYLVVYSTSASLTNSPVNGTVYTSGNALGNATVISSSAATSFTASGLSASTTYYFSVFPSNNTNCGGGPAYKTAAPLSGSIATISGNLNFYFGNFHSHSEYSDGTGVPSGDFAYGDAASCMDFLGISEHNHVSAGMSLANWNLGRAQAVSATTPTFLALYGMEWGVISTGGHVVVYGVPNLLGWDPGQYDTYAPQTEYTGTTGLFKILRSFGGNSFATLAHPNNSDFNGIMSTYDADADDAIVGTAVESGPAFSTSTTYNDPGASMSYLAYYRNMLAKGYHLGPTIDHDNHNITHGHTAVTRTVVLAQTLTENDILAAMRLMHFYASEDCSAYVTFKINNNLLGSQVTSAGAPQITVTTSTSAAVTSLKIYSGVSGSGSNATVLTSTTTGSITFTHSALANGSSRYYYIDITEADGSRIVTAPIWYSRNDTP